jgi:hypothetical protein
MDLTYYLGLFGFIVQKNVQNLLTNTTSGGTKTCRQHRHQLSAGHAKLSL